MKLVLWMVGAVLIVVTALLVWPRDGQTQPYVAESKQYSYQLTVQALKTGGNAFDLRITDRAGQPAVADSVTVEPVMPQMGHAVSPITAGPREPGHYQVDRIDLPMTGQWQITVSLHQATGSEQVVFPLVLS